MTLQVSLPFSVSFTDSYTTFESNRNALYFSMVIVQFYFAFVFYISEKYVHAKFVTEALHATHGVQYSRLVSTAHHIYLHSTIME